MKSRSDSLLKRALMANAVFSVLSGMATVILGARFADFMSVNRVLLGVVGVGVFGFGIVVLIVARRDPIDLKAASWVVLADGSWVMIAIVLIVGLPTAMSGGGRWLFGVVSVVVAGLGVGQMIGIRGLRQANSRQVDTEGYIDADPPSMDVRQSGSRP